MGRPRRERIDSDQGAVVAKRSDMGQELLIEIKGYAVTQANLDTWRLRPEEKD
jgi:hypothetical protein